MNDVVTATPLELRRGSTLSSLVAREISNLVISGEFSGGDRLDGSGLALAGSVVESEHGVSADLADLGFARGDKTVLGTDLRLPAASPQAPTASRSMPTTSTTRNSPSTIWRLTAPLAQHDARHD